MTLGAGVRAQMGKANVLFQGQARNKPQAPLPAQTMACSSQAPALHWCSGISPVLPPKLSADPDPELPWPVSTARSGDMGPAISTATALGWGTRTKPLLEPTAVSWGWGQKG